jgi:DNA-binding NtrC family response regulator
MGSAHSPVQTIGGTEATSFEDSAFDHLVGYTVAEVERELIVRTLNHLEGNRTRAAVVLGISVRCLRDKIHEFKAQGILVPEPHPSRPPNRTAAGLGRAQ